MSQIEIPNPKVIPLKGHRNWVNAVKFSPDGNHIASGDDDCTLVIWEKTSDGYICIQQEFAWNPIHGLLFSPNGEFLISQDVHGEFKIWKKNENRYVYIDSPAFIQEWRNGIVITRNEKYVVCGRDDQTLTIHELMTGELVKMFRGFRDRVKSLDISPQGDRLVLNVHNVESEGSEQPTFKFAPCVLDFGEPIGEKKDPRLPGNYDPNVV